MTLEEAKQLKPGDRVLVEMYIDDSSVFNEYGHVCLESAYVLPQDIREKVAPPRRKFRKGDIVYASGRLWKVDGNENSAGIVRLITLDKFAHYPYADIELVCAVENRADRKGGKV